MPLKRRLPRSVSAPVFEKTSRRNVIDILTIKLRDFLPFSSEFFNGVYLGEQKRSQNIVN